METDGRAYQAGVRRPILPLALRALYAYPLCVNESETLTL